MPAAEELPAALGAFRMDVKPCVIHYIRSFSGDYVQIWQARLTYSKLGETIAYAEDRQDTI